MEMERTGKQRRYGNDGADDKKLIILLLYLALYILHASCHAYSGDIICVGLILQERVACSPVCRYVCVHLLCTSVVVMAALDHLTYEGIFREVDV